MLLSLYFDAMLLSEQPNTMWLSQRLLLYVYKVLIFTRIKVFNIQLKSFQYLDDHSCLTFGPRKLQNMYF